MNLELLTHSRMQCRKTCSKKHWIEYTLGVRKAIASTPLRFGDNIHEALDLHAQGAVDGDSSNGVENGIAEIVRRYQDKPPFFTQDEWLLEREKAVRLFIGYVQRWGTEPDWEVIATEQAFTLPIINPETGHASRTFRFAGKIDKIVRLPDGRLAIVEHKTTGDSIDADSDYWPRLRIDTQISGYFHAAQQLGYDVQTCIYDVIRKPSIRPKKLSKQDRQSWMATGKYYGERFDFNANVTTETPEMYGARLSKDIEERPDFYYARKEIPRLNADIDDFAAELWYQAKSINDEQRNGYIFRNSAACLHPYPCPYRDACWYGHDFEESAPEGFIYVTEKHPELGDLNNATCTATA